MVETYEIIQLTTGTVICVDADVRREVESWLARCADDDLREPPICIDDIYGGETTIYPGYVVAIWHTSPEVRKASHDHGKFIDAEFPV